MRIFVYNLREFDELKYFEEFSEKYGIEYGYTTEFPSEDNYDLVKGYDGVTILSTPTPASLIDAMKERGVKVISTRTIGYDHIDVDHARSVGMGIAHVTYEPAAVADYTIMLMLLSCRKMKYVMARSDIQDFTLNGKIGKDIDKCTIGVIGTGRIGRTVIKHLSGFGCRILAYDIYENEEVKSYATYADLDTIYKESDIITLHAPATDDNYHMLNEQAFAKMKDGVIIVNCARGQLIDTAALITALKDGKVGQAALDVIEDELDLYYKNLEGQIIDNPYMMELKSFHNVFFSPHTAFYTETSVSNMVENSIVGIKAYLNGEDHPFIVK